MSRNENIRQALLRVIEAVDLSAGQDLLLPTLAQNSELACYSDRAIGEEVWKLMRERYLFAAKVPRAPIDH